MAKCEERAGFLFSHACDERVADSCSGCSKSICQLHSHLEGGTLICSSCVKKSYRKERRHSQRQGGSYRSRHRHSPFFYHDHYHGYGYYHVGHWGSHHLDRNDFTEADAESLTGDASEGFEDDVGGS